MFVPGRHSFGRLARCRGMRVRRKAAVLARRVPLLLGTLAKDGILALLNQSRYSLHLKHMSAVTHAQVLNGAH